MSAFADKKVDEEREKRLAAARRISKNISDKTIAAGVTLEELKKDTYKVYLNVKEDRRTRCS